MDERLRRIVEGPLVVRVDSELAVDVRADIPYRDDLSEKGPRLDVYSPSQRDERPRPAWIFVHGGPLPEGASLPTPRRWRFFRDYGAIAAGSGRVGIVVDHRYRGPDAVATSASDLEAALGWVRSHAAELGLDPERLALWAFSGAGVHLPTLLRRPPAGVRSIVAFYPAMSLASLAAMGATTLTDADAARPLRAEDVDGAPRLFLARAGLDHPALLEELDRLTASLIASGLVVELTTHPAGHHGFELQDDDARSREIVESALRFLVRGEDEHEPAPRLSRPPDA